VGVSPCGLADRERGIISFTTSLGFGKKLDHIVRDPRVALAYHTREHGFSSSPRFVLAQGIASVDLEPSTTRLSEVAPQAADYVGEFKEGPGWDWLLREYYTERVFVDVDVARVVTWPDLGATGEPLVTGAPWLPAARPQQPPKGGTTPRVDVGKVAQKLSSLPHRLLVWRGADGHPIVTPVALGGHESAGLRIIAPRGLLPAGGRRAGLLAHSYRPQLIGLSTQILTGWLRSADDGTAVYAPHTSKGYTAPPHKDLLLVGNGLIAKVGNWKANRMGFAERIKMLAAQRQE